MYDCIVIGGGPAGLMASIAAAEHGANVLLIEKGNRLGRKLAISGGGRCNVTNRMPINELIQHIPGNGKFLYSAFSIFNNEDIIHMFNKMGITLKEEDHGRMFPVTDKAQSVIDALINKINSLRIKIMLQSPVKSLLFQDNQVTGLEFKNGERIHSKTVILAVGGKSVPQTGSTGDGYEWAKEAGHTITDLYPTEVPLISNESFIKQKKLQGLALRDVSLSVLNEKEKVIVTHRMDLLFTHFGISGPAALRCSQFVIKQQRKIKKDNVTMRIDLFPDKKEEQISNEIEESLKLEPKKSIKNVLKGYLPERYLLLLLEQVEIYDNTSYSSLHKNKLLSLVKLIKEFTFQVQGTLPIEQAFITGGGVSIKEIDPKSMSSKLINGLYFSGELIDIHGYTGGFNITAAFVTGYVAGMNAAKESRKR